MNVLENRPMFNLRIHTFGVKYFLILNGVTIMSEFSSSGQLTTSLPVNQWMHPSENTISVEVYPDEEGGVINPNAIFKLDIEVTNRNNPEDVLGISIMNLKGNELSNASKIDVLESGHYRVSQGLQLDSKGQIVVRDGKVEKVSSYPGAHKYSREITLPNALPLWAFFSSDTLPDYDAMNDDDYYSEVDKLFKLYEDIQNALIAKDVEEIIKMCSERSKEIDQAFYLTPGATEERLKESLREDLNSEELELSLVEKRMLGITLEENRKLVSLTREGETNAIAFQIKGGGSSSYPFIFRYDGERWVITR